VWEYGAGKRAVTECCEYCYDPPNSVTMRGNWISEILSASQEDVIEYRLNYKHFSLFFLSLFLSSFFFFTSPLPLFRLPYFYCSLSVCYFAVSKSRNRLYAVSLFMFLDHTQSDTHTHTRGGIPLNKWSARRRGHFIHKSRTSIPTVGFEPAIPAIERSPSYALDSTATRIRFLCISIYLCASLSVADRQVYQCIR
jgi:hypothetical protein